MLAMFVRLFSSFNLHIYCVNFFFATEKKFHERRGSPSDVASALSSKQTEEIENDLIAFLSLYTSNIGYLYLLDERTGVPMIKNTREGPSTYPIIISNAYATVDKLLPLMQMGMTLMRGEVALKVLGQVICLGANTISPRSWVRVSQDIAKLMYCGQRAIHLSDEEKDKLMNLRDNLVQYESMMSEKIQREGLGFEDGSEWVVEMSFFRTVLEKFDSRRSYAGLKSIKDHGRLIWTRQVASNEQAGDIKMPGDYVETRYRYDAFIYTSINVNQEDGSEVSSMTSVYFEESAETSQSPSDRAEDKIPAVIIQTLSAVCEEENDESSGDGKARGEKVATTTESEDNRVSPINSNVCNDPVAQNAAEPNDDEYTESIAIVVEDFEGGRAFEDPTDNNDEAVVSQANVATESDGEYTEITASSGESSSPRGTYTAALEVLEFHMDNNAQTEEGRETASSEANNKKREEARTVPQAKEKDTAAKLQPNQEGMESECLSLGEEEEISTKSSTTSCKKSEPSEVDVSNNISFNSSEEKEGKESRSGPSQILDEYQEPNNTDNALPTAEGKFCTFCELQARSCTADGIDFYKRLHPGTQTIKFVLTECAGVTNNESVNSGVVGLSIMDGEENPIEGEQLGTADELLAFVSNSIQLEQDIQEKDTQIRDMQNAMVAYDSLKAAEINEKEIAIRELTRRLRLYGEEEFHSVATPRRPNNSNVELSMAIHSTYDGNGGMRTDEDVKHDIASKIIVGMKAHLYDLHHTHLSKDLEIERLRLAFHLREIEMIREKNGEIASLHNKSTERDI